MEKRERSVKGEGEAAAAAAAAAGLQLAKPPQCVVSSSPFPSQRRFNRSTGGGMFVSVCEHKGRSGVQ